MTIWKQEIKITDRQSVRIPSGAKILSVQMQGDKPCIWFLCDPHQPTRLRNLALYGTGHPIEGFPGRYIGTFQQYGGELVWHLFEIE